MIANINDNPGEVGGVFAVVELQLAAEDPAERRRAA